ncbi:MAG: hypothetical protein HY898_22880 [Deltaproteobacteria bacterium]|nr:hypothetical protein [Deltaproteobacteria bacterium]
MRTCSICIHAEHEAIDRAIASGKSLREVAAEFSVGPQSLFRHSHAHAGAPGDVSADVDQVEQLGPDDDLDAGDAPELVQVAPDVDGTRAREAIAGWPEKWRALAAEHVATLLEDYPRYCNRAGAAWRCAYDSLSSHVAREASTLPTPAATPRKPVDAWWLQYSDVPEADDGDLQDADGDNDGDELVGTASGEGTAP